MIAKAREGGPHYIYSLLTGYEAPPAGLTVPAGPVLQPLHAGRPGQLLDGRPRTTCPPGGFIAMPPPLTPGQVTFDDGTPSTVDQQAKDVAAFLTWAAEPKMEERKQIGLRR